MGWLHCKRCWRHRGRSQWAGVDTNSRDCWSRREGIGCGASVGNSRRYSRCGFAAVARPANSSATTGTGAKGGQQEVRECGTTRLVVFRAQQPGPPYGTGPEQARRFEPFDLSMQSSRWHVDLLRKFGDAVVPIGVQQEIGIRAGATLRIDTGSVSSTTFAAPPGTSSTRRFTMSAPCPAPHGPQVGRYVRRASIGDRRIATGLS